jgi:hypothetical protein
VAWTRAIVDKVHKVRLWKFNLVTENHVHGRSHIILHYIKTNVTNFPSKTPQNRIIVHAKNINQHSKESTIYRCLVKGLPVTCHAGTEGEVEAYLYSFLTTVLDGSGCSVPHPDCFTPRKEPQYPPYRRLGGPQGLSGEETISCAYLGSNPKLSSLYQVATQTTLSQPPRHLVTTNKMFDTTLGQGCQHTCCSKSNDSTKIHDKTTNINQQILGSEVTFYWL